MSVERRPKFTALDVLRQLLSAQITLFIGILASTFVQAYPGDVFNSQPPVPTAPVQSSLTVSLGQYDVAPTTGGSEYAVPIYVPPGRKGMQPTLSLVYSSHAPLRGGVAAGWNLPIPVIEVDTKDGRLAAVHYTSSLAGGQRLIEVEEPGTDEAAVTYRAENDATYTRYEKWPTNNGQHYWVVRTTDGLVYYFGDDVTSRDTPTIENYASEARWFLTRIEDPFGNRVQYHYRKVQGAALNGRLPQVPVDILISSIEFTENENAGLKPHARLEFEYAPLKTCGGSNVPIGAHFDYRTGIRLYKGALRLTKILLKVRQNPQDSFDNNLRRVTELQYVEEALECDQDHAPLRILKSIQERAINLEGEEVIAPATVFHYGDFSRSFDATAFATSLSQQETSVSTAKGRRRLGPLSKGGWPTVDKFFLDLDGDSRPDILRANPRERSAVCTFEWSKNLGDGTFGEWKTESFGTHPWFGSSNVTAVFPLSTEDCNLAYQITRRRNVDKNNHGACAGASANYISHRYMDLDADGDPDLVTALTYKPGTYSPQNDPVLNNPLVGGDYPQCRYRPYCRDKDGMAVGCRTRVEFGRFDFFTGLSLNLGGSGLGSSSPVPTNPDGSCPEGMCKDQKYCSQFCQCSTEACPTNGWNDIGDETSPPDGIHDWLGAPYSPGIVGQGPQSIGGNKRCIQSPEMRCSPISSDTETKDVGKFAYVWRVYWNEREKKDLSNLVVANPNIGSSMFSKKPTVIYSPVPLESDRAESPTGGEPSSSWHGFEDIDGDGFLDAIWQDPETFDELGPTGHPGAGPTGRFLVFRGDGTGQFKARPDGEPWEWKTPKLDRRTRISQRRTGNIPEKKTKDIMHRYVETVISLVDINGDGLPDYVESRALDNRTNALRVFYNTGAGFEHHAVALGTTRGGSGGDAGTRLSTAFDTLSREEQVVLSREKNGHLENGWQMSVRHLLDFDQDGRADIINSPPPEAGQTNPWIREDSDNSQPTADPKVFFNVGDRFIEGRQAPALKKVAHAVGRYQISSGGIWSVKSDVIDFDGDGLFDALNNGDNAQNCFANEISGAFSSLCGNSTEYLKDTKPLRLMTRIDNGKGASISYDYAPSSNTSVVTQEASRITLPMWVLSKTTVNTNGQDSTTDFYYKGPVANRDPYGHFAFRGFQEIERHLPPNHQGQRAIRIDRFDYDLDYSGRFQESQKLGSDQRPHEIERIRWKEYKLFEGKLTTYHQRDEKVFTCDPGTHASATDCVNQAPFLEHTFFWAPISKRMAEPGRNFLDTVFSSGDDSELVTARSDKVLVAKYGDLQIRPDGSRAIDPNRGVVDPGYWVEPPPPPPPTRDIYCAGEDTDSTDDSVPVAIVMCGQRLSDQGGPVAPRDRGQHFAYALNHGAQRYEISKVLTEKFWSLTGGELDSPWGDIQLSGKEVVELDDEGFALPVRITVALDETTTATVERTFDVSTGLLESIKDAEQFAADSDAVTGVTFDSEFRIYLSRIQNAVGHTREFEVDLATGAITRATMPTQPGLGAPFSRLEHDGFGRVTGVFRAIEDENGQLKEFQISENEYLDQQLPNKIRNRASIDYGGEQWSDIVTEFDGLKRPTTQTVLTPLGPAQTVLARDAVGNTISVTTPHPQSPLQTVVSRYEYDDQGRVIKIRPPMGAPIEIKRNGLLIERQELVTDNAVPRPIRAEFDVFGRLQRITEKALDGSAVQTLFAYDPDDYLSEIIDADGVITTLEHDFVGRRREVNRGGRIRRFDYDLNSQLTAIWDTPDENVAPENYLTVFEYDNIQRLSRVIPARRDLSDEQLLQYKIGTTEFEYDLPSQKYSNARLSRVTSPLGVSQYEYSAEGWLERLSMDISVDPYQTEYSREISRDFVHNAQGQVVLETHPTLSGSPYASFTNMDIRGLPVSLALGEMTPQASVSVVADISRSLAGFPIERSSFGQVQTWTLDALGRIVQNEVQQGPELIAGETMSYDSVGNVDASKNLAFGLDFSYKYDPKHQLIDAIESQQSAYSGQFSYTPGGKLKLVDVASPLESVFSRDAQYQYQSAADPAAVSSLKSLVDGSTLLEQAHDANANVTRRLSSHGAVDFVYDGDNQLREVTYTDANGELEKETYFYDHKGNRLLSIKQQPDELGRQGTLWFGNTEMYFDEIGEATGSNTYVGIGSQPLVRIVDDEIANPQAVYTGALDHVLAVVSEDGLSKTRFAYGPYGEILAEEGSNAQAISRRFNGKPLDRVSGLSYYGRRYYDPLTLNWTQTDPLYEVSPDSAIEETRRLALYAFAYNNPVRYVDPDGLDPEGSGGATVTIGEGEVWVDGKPVPKGPGSVFGPTGDDTEPPPPPKTEEKKKPQGQKTGTFESGPLEPGSQDSTNTGTDEKGEGRPAGDDKGHRRGSPVGSIRGVLGGSDSVPLFEGSSWGLFEPPMVTPRDKMIFDFLLDIADAITLAKTITKKLFSEGLSAVKKLAKETCCFGAGTLVDTEDGLRPIEQIAVGDKVWSQNVATGELSLKPVTHTIRRHDRVIWNVQIVGEADEVQEFETTDDHPWWINDGHWKETRSLSVGDSLVTRDGATFSVHSVTRTDRRDATFNLSVADFETYFVGQDKVLVHNCKVFGKGQVTRKGGKPTTHGSTSERIAGEMAESGDYVRVHMNQSVGTVTDGAINGRVRPDVAGVKADGTVDVVEVLSPKQTRKMMEDKLVPALDDRCGTILCVNAD